MQVPLCLVVLGSFFFLKDYWEGTEFPCHGTWRVWPCVFALSGAQHNLKQLSVALE